MRILLPSFLTFFFTELLTHSARRPTQYYYTHTHTHTLHTHYPHDRPFPVSTHLCRVHNEFTMRRQTHEHDDSCSSQSGKQRDSLLYVFSFRLIEK